MKKEYWNKDKKISKEMKQMIYEIEGLFKNKERVVFDLMEDFQTKKDIYYRFTIYQDREMLIWKLDLDKIQEVLEKYSNDGCYAGSASIFVNLYKREIEITFSWKKGE